MQEREMGGDSPLKSFETRDSVYDHGKKMCPKSKKGLGFISRFARL